MRRTFLICLIACGPLPPRDPPAKPVAGSATRVQQPPPREYPPVTVRGARSRFTLEILGAETVGTIDPKAVKVAHTLTVGLRALAGTDAAISLGKKNLAWVDAKTMASCTDDDIACAKKIANTIAVDKVIYGTVNDLGEGDYYVVFTLFDKKTGAAVKWTGRTQAEDPDLVYTAKVAFDSLIWQGS